MGRCGRPALAAMLIGLLGSGCEDKAAEVEQNAQRVAPASTVNATEAVVDGARGFRLRWPGPGWKLLHEVEARQLSAGAAAGALSADGITAVVMVRTAPAAPLDRQVDGLVQHLGLQEPKVEQNDATTLEGREARRFVVIGSLDGVALRYAGLVVQRQHTLYRLLLWTSAADSSVQDERFDRLFDAFALLDAEPKPVTRELPPDAVGEGWRVTKGTFESAVSGVRLRPPERWRLLMGPPLERLSPDAEVGARCTDPPFTVLLRSEPVPEAQQEGLVERFVRQVKGKPGAADAPRSASDGGAAPAGAGARPKPTPWASTNAPPWDARPAVAPSPWAAKPDAGPAKDGIRWFEPKLAGGPGRGVQIVDGKQERVLVTRCAGQRCLRVSARYELAERAGARDALLELLSAVERLEATEHGRLEIALNKVAATRDVVGSKFALRGGVYTDFEWGFAWHKPDGFWRMVAGASARALDPDARLYVEHQGLGVQGLVLASAAAVAKQPSYHQALVARLGATMGLVGAAPQKAMVDDVDGYVSDGLVGDGPDAVRYRVVTVVQHGSALRMLLWGRQSVIDADPGSLATAVSSLRLQAVPAQVETKAERYHDRRLGFSFQPPAGWRALDLTPPELGPRGSFVRWGQDGRWVAIVAACVLESGQDQTWFIGLLEQLLRDELGPISRGSPKIAVLTIGERAVRHLSWTASLHRVDALLMHRGHTVYAVLAVDRGDEALEQAKSGFALLP